jgi:hypothetical protein
MGIKRIVDTAFWTDSKVDEFTPEDKYFMIYLLTNPFTTQLGIYEISIKQVAFQLGYSIEAVNSLIDRFANKYGVIYFSNQTNEIAIKNYLRHSVIKGGKPVEDCIKKEMLKVKDKNLIKKVFNFVADKDDLNTTVKKIVTEYINNNDFDNENDNDNENDVSYHDSYHDSSTNRSKPVRHKYGLYKNVLLSDADLEKLKAEFVDWEQRIERLSEYMASKGKSYKNHLATIRAWSRRDEHRKVGANGIAISNEKSDLDGVF